MILQSTSELPMLLFLGAGGAFLVMLIGGVIFSLFRVASYYRGRQYLKRQLRKGIYLASTDIGPNPTRSVPFQYSRPSIMPTSPSEVAAVVIVMLYGRILLDQFDNFGLHR